MRPSCLDCVAKHVAKAIILLSESELGYQEHKYLAIGNLSEAEDESVQLYPSLAKRIRRIRRAIEVDSREGAQLMNLLKLIARKKKQEK